jgi:hypothetical protein
MTKLPAEYRPWGKPILTRQHAYRLALFSENRVIEVKVQEPKDYPYVLPIAGSWAQAAFGTP